MRRRGAAGLLLAVFALLGAACAPLQREHLTAERFEQALEAGSVLEQRFTAGYGGLEGVRVQMRSEGQPAALLLTLRGGQEGADLLATERLEVSGDGEVTLRFAALADSTLRSYVLALRVLEGSLRAGTLDGEAYLNGGLARGGEPTGEQLAFSLDYAPGLLFRGLASEVLGWLGWLFLYVLGCGGLGWGLFMLLSPRERGEFQFLLGLSAGLGFVPLLLLLADAGGLRLGAGWFWGWAGAGIAFALAVKLLRGRRNPRWVSGDKNEVLWLAALVLVSGLVLLARWWAFRLYPAPFWGDAVQHAVITQLILDHGGLFQSWLPYAPYQSFTQQYGFPALAAGWSWLSGQDAVGGNLAFGQGLNALAVLVWLPLAWRLGGRSRGAALAAVAVMGLLSPLPGMYSNWGRYAQLAGQSVLPAALWLGWDLLEGKGRQAGKVALLGAVLAGLLLCYYRALFSFLTFVLPLFFLLLAARRGQWRGLLPGLGKLALAAGMAGLLLLPWILRVQGSTLAANVETGLAGGTAWENVAADYIAWRTELPVYPLWLLLAGAAAFLLALWRRHWPAVLVGVWAVLLGLVKAGALLRIPGANMMQSSAAVFALYIPLGLLLGWLVGEALEVLERSRIPRGAWTGAAGLAALAALGLGTVAQMRIARPYPYNLVTWADMRAGAWIREHTAADAVFLVEGFHTHGGRLAVGADAGWWLPLIAGRANTMPPQYALGNEVPQTPGYTEAMVGLVTQLRGAAPDDPESLRLLCAAGVTHAYIGQRQGLASLEQIQLFSAEALDASAAFRRVYARDQVRIYELKRESCAGR